MLNDQKYAEFYELMSHYLSGNANDSEVLRLETWVQEKPEHRALFMQYKKAWLLSGMKNNPPSLDVNEEWEAIAGQLELSKAASAAKNTAAQLPEAREKTAPKLVKMPAKKTRGNAGWWRIAAGLLLLAGAALWIFNQSNDGSMNVLAENTVMEQGLPDGSEVALNQFASLSFNQQENNRQVQLKGDAFFEVARDTEHPFVIKAEEVEIEVLGTSFYVDAREGLEQIQVMVKSGSVAVRSGQQEVILTKNEAGIFDKAKKELVKTAVANDNYLAWKTQELVFENSTLKEVVFALNRQYHAQIIIDSPAIDNCTLTATYKQKSLAAVLTIIEQSLGLTVKKSGDIYRLSGAGC